MGGFLKFYTGLVYICGNLFLLLVLIDIIKLIVKSIMVSKHKKMFRDIVKNSTFVEDTLGPMTEAEKESMEKTGRAETLMKIDIDSLNAVDKKNVCENMGKKND